MLLIVTPNLNIDRTYVVPGFSAGAIFRPETVKVYACGKGVNVARVLLELGGEPMVVGFTGGHNGSYIKRSLREQGIPAATVEVDGESRVCSIIVDPVGGRDTVINERGPQLNRADAERLLEEVRRLMPRADMAIISGSLPRGLNPDLYTESVRLARESGVRVILDASGDNLRRGAAAGPFLVKPNREELTEWLGYRPDGLPEMAKAVRAGLAEGTEAVCVSLGIEGALLVERSRAVRYRQPEVAAVSCIGCGDAMLAGMALSLLRGEDLGPACRLGLAAAAANTLIPGPGLCRRDDVERLINAVSEEEII